MPASASAIGRIKVLGSAPATSAPSSSVAAQAFGGSTDTGTPGLGSVAGFHGVGIKFWSGVAGLALLIWVYHSLPE